MDFVANREPQIEEMLREIGVSDVKELFSAIEEKLRVERPVEDDGLSEYDGIQHMEALAAKNTYPRFENYLGGGAYEHHIPALVDSICSKGEFLTAYTPYQAEASQGGLQAIFEFQTAVCTLTGMDVANASAYDGASACAEALLMALRHKKGRSKVVVARSLHPHYRGLIDQYLCSHDVEIVEAPFNLVNLELDEQTAAVLVQSPNFLGMMEDVKSISEKAKKVGALTIVSANPLVYGIYASAAEMGADIAVGDCQPFGMSLQFGGPYAGYIACKKGLVRQLPGRLVGETVDTKGRRGFVLTLQAREQHIRREKATSNICTNQALAALASLVTMLWYGKEGIPKLALTNYQRTAYLRDRLMQHPHVSVLDEAPFFNEFAVSFGQPVEQVQKHFRAHDIEPGIALGNYYPELKDYLLVAVTEIKNRAQLDRYCKIAEEMPHD